MNGTASVGLLWPSLLTFIRLVTNPRIFIYPETVDNAWQQVEEWLNCSPIWIPQPTERHRDVLKTLLMAQSLQANLIHDAHLAALAIEHGLILCSTDSDLSRFAGLRWENPLRI